jgi:Polysaccharide lyase 14
MPRLFIVALWLCVSGVQAQVTLWQCNFTSTNWFAEWNNIDAPKNGIAFGGTNITQVIDSSAPGGAFLRIAYPSGSYAPSGFPPSPIGGTQFYGAVLHTNGYTPLNALILQFSVRFPTGFNFVKGGKLPGLYGGTGNTGTVFPNGTDGFTTRFMWRTSGAGEAYPFLPTSAPNDGTELGKGDWYFSGDNQWHTIRQKCVLNDVGASNGVIQVWYDGVLVLNANNLYFRSTDSLQIDGVIFQTFFGGGDTSWATPMTTYADFAAFSVSDPNQINPPLLTISPADDSVILSWPTNGTSGYQLEASTDIGPSNAWNVIPNSFVTGDHFTVTNIIGSTNYFYRLHKP